MNRIKKITLICISILALSISVLAAENDTTSTLKSKWDEKIKPVDYPDAEAPGEYEIKWDFSDENITTYTLSVKTKIDVNSGNVNTETTNIINGKFVIKALVDNTATLYKKDMRVELFMPDGEQQENKSKPLPDVAFPGMLEDSDFDGTPQSMTAYMGKTFPLPLKKIRIGETKTRIERMPVVTPTAYLAADGLTTVTLHRFVKTPDGSVCAEMEVFTVIDNLNAANDSGPKYDVFVQNHGMYYFDVGQRVFHSGKTAGVTIMSMEANNAPRRRMVSDSYTEYIREKQD